MIGEENGNWLGLIQASAVTLLAGFKPGLSRTSTYPVDPSKEKAWPTSPLVKVTPPTRVPLFVPNESLALPSPAHQLTKPAGGRSQEPGGSTVKTAFELLVEPRLLLTTTE